MSWLSFACCYLALLAGGLAMNTHHQRVFRCVPSSRLRRLLRTTSIVLLLVAASLSIVASGGPVGAVALVAMIAIGGLTFAALLVLAPRWLGLPALILLLAAFL